MKLNLVRENLKNGTYNNIFQTLYGEQNVAHQIERYLHIVDGFASKFGADRDVSLFSVPGRTEISGNHTDHNNGCVLAAAVDLDIIAVASKKEAPEITFFSEDFSDDTIDLNKIEIDPAKFYTSESILAGTVDAFRRRTLKTGGFDAYATSNVFKGSGLSSSAAYEVMIGNILSHFYNDGSVDAPELAKIGQEAENIFFGKPCGLMDQTACAVGSFVYIDFADPKAPIIEKLPFDLSAAGYRLCIINTGGNHADLNDDYASVPAEMKAVARKLGHEVLRDVTYDQLLKAIPELRKTVGDRAILRAIHYLGENVRVGKQREALRVNDLDAFFAGVTASGNSSYKRLQNVYTVKNVEEQGLSLAITVAENLLEGKKAACRVHGGGFAGTIQAFVPQELLTEFVSVMDSVFGEGACHILSIRPYGAICVDRLV
jgi:galactokinase